MFTSPHLRTIPTIFSSEDRARLKSAVMLRPHQVTILYENLLSRYGDFPYLLVRLAQLRAAMGSPVLSAALFSKVSENKASRRLHFVVFSEISAGLVQYHQSWKQTEEHNFPRQIHAPPSGYEQVKEEWSSLVKDNSEFLAKYLRHVAVETNIIEDTFLLTTECLHNIIRDGVSPAIIVTEYDSETHDRDIIKSILNDTLEDGNGRLSRIMASIPLIQAGYPPIAISMIRRPMYYQAINEAYDGNHSLFIQCIFEGMKATMDTVRGLL
ncbi:hypothetical protein C0989_002155 [Termitomyces sp. Mn162]|nr:hypothetical protein C0989_002155 [Termitomyces sp. Mn162]